MKQSKGITLVALVITIILLLILAGISIQAITNQGIFEQAHKARKETQRAQVTEWLNLKLMEVQMQKPTGTAEEIIEATRVASKGNTELAKMGKKVVVDENTSILEDGEQVPVYFYVQVDEDVYKVEMIGAKFIGEQGKFPPVITLENVTKTTNSITLKIKTSRNEEGELKIYIKSEDDEDYTLKKTATGNEATGLEHTFEGLEQNKNYSIKIVATAKNGQIKEYIKDVPLGSVPDLKDGSIEFIYSVDDQTIDKNTWTNKEVTVTASTEIKEYILQTSKDGETWINTNNQKFTENGTIYVRLYDGKNYGGSASVNVINIDTTKPTINTYVYSRLALDYTKWEFVDGAYAKDNILVLPKYGAIAVSDFYYVDGKKWWVEGVGQTDTLSQVYANLGGLYMEIFFYDINKISKVANNIGLSANGWANGINLGVLTPFEFGTRYSEYGQSNDYGWGEDVKYVRIRPGISEYCSPITMYSDIRFYTEAETSNYSKIIETTITDNNEIKLKKYLPGSKNINDFKIAGIEFNDKIEVMENGIYTIYTEDIAGNISTKIVEIKGIE